MNAAQLQKIRLGLLCANIKLGKITKDAYSGPKDPNPENWRTLSGAHVHLENGRIDGGAGGKFSGNNWVGKEMHASDPRAQEGDLFGQYGWSVPESKSEREEKEKKKNLEAAVNKYKEMESTGNQRGANEYSEKVYQLAREFPTESKEYKEALKAIEWSKEDVESAENDYKEQEHKFEENKAAWEKMQKKNGKTALEKLEEKLSAKKKELEAGTENKITESKYMPVSTIKEADEYITKSYGIQASYKGVDVEVANAWNESLTDSFETFPELKSNMGFVGEAHNRYLVIKERVTADVEEWLNNYYGSTKPSNFNDLVKRQVSRRMGKHRVSSNWFGVSYSGGTGKFQDLNGIFANSATGKKANEMIEALKRSVAIGYHPIGCDTIKSVADHEIGHQLDSLLRISTSSDFLNYYHTLKRDDIVKGLSQYAATKKREFLAEAWAEYRNNPSPRPIAKKVGEIVENAYKNFKGAKT